MQWWQWLIAADFPLVYILVELIKIRRRRNTKDGESPGPLTPPEGFEE